MKNQEMKDPAISPGLALAGGSLLGLALLGTGRFGRQLSPLSHVMIKSGLAAGVVSGSYYDVAHVSEGNARRRLQLRLLQERAAGKDMISPECLAELETARQEMADASRQSAYTSATRGSVGGLASVLSQSSNTLYRTVAAPLLSVGVTVLNFSEVLSANKALTQEQRLAGKEKCGSGTIMGMPIDPTLAKASVASGVLAGAVHIAHQVASNMKGVKHVFSGKPVVASLMVAPLYASVVLGIGSARKEQERLRSCDNGVTAENPEAAQSVTPISDEMNRAVNGSGFVRGALLSPLRLAFGAVGERKYGAPPWMTKYVGRALFVANTAEALAQAVTTRVERAELEKAIAECEPGQQK